jgi:hypothetical protein
MSLIGVSARTLLYLGDLVDQGAIEQWRLLRRKLGLGSGAEFKVLIETRDLAQLDEAFRVASARADPAEGLHHGVNSMVVNFEAGLYRDFPTPIGSTARSASEPSGPLPIATRSARPGRGPCAHALPRTSSEP